MRRGMGGTTVAISGWVVVAWFDLGLGDGFDRRCGEFGRSGGFGPFGYPFGAFGRAGDEFVCGLNGTDLAQAERRFDSIGVAIEADTTVSISVGLAALAVGDTADDLTQRADAAMLKVKAEHHSRE